MVKSTQNIDRAELQRRQKQSRSDLESNRQREQAARDRARSRQARNNHQSTRSLMQNTWFSTPTYTSTLNYDLFVSSEPITMPPALPWKTTSDSAGAFDSLFNSNKYSDATVYLGQSRIPFPAHRLVLGTRSPYFDDALQSGFKEGITHEISFEEDSPHALWRVLHYIYIGDYSEEPSEVLNSEVDDVELLRHPRVYALADMFRMEDLMKVSCTKFELQLRKHWISDTLPDCIREVYLISSNSTAIRKVVVDAVSLHMKDLIQKVSFQELIREVGDFAVDLVLKIADN